MHSRYLFVLFFIINCLTIVYGQKRSGYKLVWSDEFNKAGHPDSSIWNFEYGFVRNHEQEWYQSQNALCVNGRLIIESKKVHLPNPKYNADSKNWKFNRQWINFTSASLNTSGRKSWQYGRFVMRAKIDTDKGLWPAFWTLGEKGSWPSNGEIDIMEYYRDYLLANVACGTKVPNVAKWFSKKRPISSFNIKNWSKKFHIWRMDWTKQSIKIFVDNELLNSVSLDSLNNPDGINPFREPHYILLNLAIGGDNGGNPDSTVFPKKYEIDYVRVYQQRKTE